MTTFSSFVNVSELFVKVEFYSSFESTWGSSLVKLNEKVLSYISSSIWSDVIQLLESLNPPPQAYIVNTYDSAVASMIVMAPVVVSNYMFEELPEITSIE